MSVFSRRVTIVVLLAIGFMASCTKPPQTEPAHVAKAPTVPASTDPDELPTVMFDLKPIHSAGSLGGDDFDCEYRSHSKSAKFRLAFSVNAARIEGDPTVTKFEGKFIAVPNSDNSVLIDDLRVALDGKKLPSKQERAQELAFDAIVLGDHMKRESDGSHSPGPGGNWTVLKLFLPRGHEEAQIFLSVNLKEGKGDFCMKDPDYAGYLLQEFAKVL